MVFGWARYSPEDFIFTAKVPQTVTHDRLLDISKGAGTDLANYCELMRPLLEAEKLGPLLLQLPPRLRFDEKYIETFFEILPKDFQFALEPRNKTWIIPEAFELLRKYNVVYTIVDEPLLPPDIHITSNIAYFRWHGHGQQPWYDYRYTLEELESWAPKVKETAEKSKIVYGYFNNHFHGYAPENCLQILKMIDSLGIDQAKALKRIEDFRRGFIISGRQSMKGVTLEDFTETPIADPELDPLLAHFLDKARLDRAKRIASSEVHYTEENNIIDARVKDYKITIELEAKRIEHDCEDWTKRVAKKVFCKHIGKLLFILPRNQSLSLLKEIHENIDNWAFTVIEP